MSIKEALAEGKAALDAKTIYSAKLDSELLMSEVTGHNRTWIAAHDNEELDGVQLAKYRDLIVRRAEHTPLVHLTGKREFYGLELNITPDVLTPRVETETMVDWAIKHAPQNSRLIDIGTGSGAIALAIKHHRPDLDVWGTDISEKELDVARKNAEKLKLNITVVQSDLFASVDGRFATVVTNLPYLKDNEELMPEVQKEPAVALFGGEDGLDLYRRFLQQLPDHLEEGGYLFTECDPWQQADLTEEAAKIGLKEIEEDMFILGFKLTD